MDQADAELRATICKVSWLKCRNYLFCKMFAIIIIGVAV